MKYQESLKKVSDYIIRLYLENADDRRYFHNIAHKFRVLDAINKINEHYRLDDKTYFIICAAAWLENSDLIISGDAMTESKMVINTNEFLENLHTDSDDQTEIKKCIAAAFVVQQQSTLPEKIIFDAFSFYLGSETFVEYNHLMRREIEAFTGNKIRGSEWRERTISLLENHEFQTEYCQSLLNKTKEENLQYFIRKHGEKHWVRHPANENNKQRNVVHGHTEHLHHRSAHQFSLSGQFTQSANPGKQFENKEIRASKIKHHLRGVETMFRNSSSNHLRLSVMADNKAFIMISVNSILISVGIGLIIGKFVLAPKLFIPTVILLTVNVITIIYSVLATRPGTMKGKFTKKELDEKTVDLLFFGSYYKMPLEDFEFGIRQLMNDIEFLYANLIKDIYLQGKILGRKYHLLRISYNIFMYGTVLSVVAYIMSFFF
jgi:Family of unknown function (DUF5706)